jgi:hypothetical protein
MDGTDHVCAAMVNGKLHTDANENQETVVHTAVAVETIRDVVNRLEENQPWNLIVRGFGPGTSVYLGFRFLHLTIHLWQVLVRETTLVCPQRSFFLAYFTNCYLPSQNYI